MSVRCAVAIPGSFVRPSRSDRHLGMVRPFFRSHRLPNLRLINSAFDFSEFASASRQASSTYLSQTFTRRFRLRQREQVGGNGSIMKRSLFGQSSGRCAGQIGVWSNFLWGLRLVSSLVVYCCYLLPRGKEGGGTGAQAPNGRKATVMGREEATLPIVMNEWDPVYNMAVNEDLRFTPLCFNR